MFLQDLPHMKVLCLWPFTRRNFWPQWKVSFPLCHLATLALEPVHGAPVCVTTDSHAPQTVLGSWVSACFSPSFPSYNSRLQVLILLQLTCCQGKLHWKRSQCVLEPPYASSRDEDAAGQVGAGGPLLMYQLTRTVAPWSLHSMLHGKLKTTWVSILLSEYRKCSAELHHY